MSLPVSQAPENDPFLPSNAFGGPAGAGAFGLASTCIT